VGVVTGVPLTEKLDTELAALARDGDKDAFGVLVARYQMIALRFALRLTGREDIAQDVAQEAMLQAFLSLAGLRDAARFKSWLLGIVLNVSRHYLREKRVANFSLEAIIQGLHFYPAPLYDAPASPEQLIEDQERYRIVFDTVNALPAADRDSILLFYYGQLSLQETAVILNLPEGTVKVRLHRARLRLKTLLQERHPEMVPPRKRRKKMVKVSIADVIKAEIKDAEEPLNIQYVIILYDETGRRVLPIWVGPFEGESIAIGLSDMAIARPPTHRFFSTLLQGIGASIEEVSVSALKVNTFYGLVKLRCGKKTVEIDARPSDAIALAILNNAPIQVAEEVLETAGLAIPAAAKGKPNRKNLTGIIKTLEEKHRKFEARISQPQKPPELTEEQKAKRDASIAAIFGE
jgi:RNA polymerase sigma factor (sigma-70 family)